MFNSAIFGIHGAANHTRVHLEGSSGEKVQNPKEQLGQVFTYHLEPQLIVLLIALIINFTLAELKMLIQRMVH